MDPYFYACGVEYADHKLDACAPGCDCELGRHVRRLFVGRATSTELAEWQATLNTAVAGRKMKAEKVAERNKAKKKAQKARKKAAAAAEAATGEPEGQVEGEVQGGSQNDNDIDDKAPDAGSDVDPIVLAARLGRVKTDTATDAATKTKVETNTKTKNANHPVAQPNNQSKSAALANHTSCLHTLQRNLLCPVCSPRTSLIPCFKASVSYDPLRDRPCCANRLGACCANRLGVHDPCSE